MTLTQAPIATPARTELLAFLVLLVLGGFLPAAALPEGVVRRVVRVSSGRVDTVDLEEYVASVLPAEIGGNAPRAALEAQAVAARSYALARKGRHEEQRADLCDSVHCQVYLGPRTATAASRAATLATRGLVLGQRGSVIAAPFCAVCGGRTARPAEVWDDEETPDLVPVDDDACQSSPGARWTYFLPRAELPRLTERLGLSEARYLEVYGRGADGRVSALRLVAPGGRPQVIRGFAFRAAASTLWGWTSVRSTDFQLEEFPRGYLLTGRGTGHGAGLCQAGAIVRARRGETREAILSLYYRGASVVPLETLNVAR